MEEPKVFCTLSVLLDTFDQSSKTRGNEYVHCDCVGQLKYLERLFKYLETLPNTEYERSACNSIIIPFIDIM